MTSDKGRGKERRKWKKKSGVKFSGGKKGEDASGRDEGKKPGRVVHLRGEGEGPLGVTTCALRRGKESGSTAA